MKAKPIEFTHPRRLVEHAYINSFNGRLRDRCSNMRVFVTLENVRGKLNTWREDYARVLPYSSSRRSHLARFRPRIQTEWDRADHPHGPTFLNVKNSWRPKGQCRYSPGS